jgi:hypothetical protein
VALSENKKAPIINPMRKIAAPEKRFPSKKDF